LRSLCLSLSLSARARLSSDYAALLMCARREQGEYHNGHRNGKGKQTFANGNMYDGQFLLVLALLHACAWCLRLRAHAQLCTHLYTFVHICTHVRILQICTCRQFIRVRVCFELEVCMLARMRNAINAEGHRQLHTIRVYKDRPRAYPGTNAWQTHLYVCRWESIWGSKATLQVALSGKGTYTRADGRV
jgi:hypothetical protein